MGFGAVKNIPVNKTLAELATILPAGTIAMLSNYGGTIAVSDGIRWRLERLYSTWSSLPLASSVPVGTEASITDCGGSIAVAGAAGWVFRPIEIFNSSTAVLINGSSGSSDQVGYQFTLPANILGTKGMISTETFGTFSIASANLKDLKIKLGATTLARLTWSSVHKTFSVLGRIKNLTKTSQTAMDGQIFAYGGSGANIPTSSIDTTVDTTIQITMALGSSAETCTFQGIRATAYPSM